LPWSGREPASEPKATAEQVHNQPWPTGIVRAAAAGNIAHHLFDLCNRTLTQLTQYSWIDDTFLFQVRSSWREPDTFIDYVAWLSTITTTRSGVLIFICM